MAKQQLGPTAWLAGAVALVTGGVLLWNKRASDAAKADGQPPADALEQIDCDAGYAYNPSKKECVPTSGGPPVVPSLLPDTSVAKGPMLPPRAKILIVGGELAAGLAGALSTELAKQEQALGAPVTPSAISVWSGAPVLYTFEAIAATLGVSGVPRAPECQACPPDLVIVFAGEYNMHWGPVDKGTQEAIARITDAFAVYARDHYPNILWIGPPVNPDYQEPPHKNDLSAMIFSTAMVTRPGRSSFLNPKSKSIPMVDSARPTAAGYAELARQAAAVLVAWYAANPGKAAA